MTATVVGVDDDCRDPAPATVSRGEFPAASSCSCSGRRSRCLAGLPVDTIGSRFGGVPGGLPDVARAERSGSDLILTLLSPALTVAMLGAIESLLSAVVADRMAGDRHDPNVELTAQGIANVLSPLFGGLPATGAIARTATNIRSGAQNAGCGHDARRHAAADPALRGAARPAHPAGDAGGHSPHRARTTWASGARSPRSSSWVRPKPRSGASPSC